MVVRMILLSLLSLCLNLRAGSWFQTVEEIWRSGLVGDGEMSQFRLEGIREKSFQLFWHVSSEQDYDFFEIEADGEVLLKASGAGAPWQYFAAEFTSSVPEHVLILRFVRDSSGGGGENLAEFHGLSFGEWKSGQSDGEWNYLVAGGNVFLQSYTGGQSRVVIPGTVGGFPVRGILQKPFAAGHRVTELLLEEGTVFLGDGVFQNLEDLTEVVLPHSLHFMGRYCFQNCRKLEQIAYGGDFLFSGDRIFMNCISLSRIDLSPLAGDIPPGAFWGCVSLRSFSVPAGIQAVHASAFSGSGLQRIEIPASCAVLEERALMNCPELEEIAVAAGSEFFSVREGALLDCGGEQLIFYPPARKDRCWQMPEAVRSIAPYAFFGARFLEKLVCSPEVEILPGHCLQNCSVLSELVLPEKLRCIGMEALAGCSHLRALSLSSSLEKIEEMAFCGCSSLSFLEFDGNCPSLPEQLGIAGVDFSVWRGAGWDAADGIAGVNVCRRGFLPPQILPSDGGEIVFSGQQLIDFRSPENGLEWYYTLDNRKPDSVTGRRYERPFLVDSSCSLRLRGFLKGQPATVEKQIGIIEIGELPVAEENEFLISECGDGECCIEQYLGKKKALRIPEMLFSLVCRGISAGAFAECSRLRLLECPGTLLWIELEDLPESVCVTVPSDDIAVFKGKRPGGVFSRREYSELLLLHAGWNLRSFRKTLRMTDNPRLEIHHPMIYQGKIVSRCGENILSGQPVWFWSDREVVLPLRLQNNSGSSGRKADDCPDLKYWNRENQPEAVFIWEEKRGWQKIVRLDHCAGALGWGIGE